MRSRFLGLGLSLVMIVLSGCGGSDSGGGEPAPVPSGTIVWEKTLGGAGDEEAHAIKATDDGGYIITGSTTSFGAGDSDLYLVKLNAAGDVTWEKAFGGQGVEVGYSVAQTSDGGYIVTGSTQTASEQTGTASSILLIKTDGNGSLMWERTYGLYSMNSGNFVFQRSDGGYTVAGQTSGIVSEDDFNFGELYILILDPEGAVLSEYLSDTSITTESVIAGRSYPDDSFALTVYLYNVIKSYFSGVAMANFDPQGNPGESFILQGVTGGVKAAIWTGDGGYATTGIPGPITAPPFRMLLLTFDRDGNSAIIDRFAGSGYAWGSSLDQTPDGGFIVAGETQVDEVQPADIYLVRTNAAGERLWELIHGGDGEDLGGPIAPSDDGGWVIAGSTTSLGAGGKDLYILKVVESGI